MFKPRSFFRLFTESGPLVALAVAIMLGIGFVAPASAQFFNFGFGHYGGPPRPPPPRGGGWFGGFFSPFQPQQAPRRVYQDFSRAPPPEKRETVPERNVLVMGDGMADWLAYGLEDAYADQPDMGVIRKVKNTAGLIKYQPRGEPADWAAAAKEILANEKPDAIVIMLGLNDRISIHESEPEKEKKGEKGEKKDAHGKQETKDKQSADDAKPADKDSELPPDEADNPDLPPISTEKTTRAPNGIAQFRDERWIELYTRKIEEMIAVAKSKGVPVVWVGLPAIRGTRGTSDMLFLDSLYRDAAGKSGITYVDVWDGFVDEAGRYLQKGPDFEGQIRVLRSYDGVYFTKPGARKLALYVEREVSRLLAARSAPYTLPTEPTTPEANLGPGQPAQRPLAGPILPLVASSVSNDQLLGGPGSQPAAVDALAARTLVKGEALTAPAGRADDYAWPRRQVEREPAKEPPKTEAPMASTAPAGSPPPASATHLPERERTPEGPAVGMALPRPAPKKPQPAPFSNPFRNFFRFGTTQHQPRPAVPRPPANVGRSATIQSEQAR